MPIGATLSLVGGPRSRPWPELLGAFPSEVEFRSVGLGDRASGAPRLDLELAAGSAGARPTLQRLCGAAGFEVVDDAPLRPEPPAKDRRPVTLLCEHLVASLLAELVTTLEGIGASVEAIRPLGVEPVVAHELVVSSRAAVTDVRAAGSAIADRFGCSLGVHCEGAYLRDKKLALFDMDSTLIEQEVIDELARCVGAFDTVAEITERAMRGELSFDEALRVRCRALAGAPVSVFESVQARLRLTPGVARVVRVLQRAGLKVAVISGGFIQLLDPFRRRLGLDYAEANELEISDGRLTGRVTGPIVNRERKAEVLGELARRYGISESQVLAVGDGANDLSMLQRSGMGVAFRAKPAVAAAAKFKIPWPNMLPLLYLLGLDQAQIDALDP